MKDEFEELDRETPIYFLDTIFDEFLEYVGEDDVKEWETLKQETNGFLISEEKRSGIS